MLRKISFIALSLLLVLPSAFAAEEKEAKETLPTYTQKDTTITVTASEPQFVLKLKANPSTGYSWFLRDYNHDLIVPEKRQYVQPDSKLIGAPGFDLWTFKVKADAFVVPQQIELKMIYARANDKSDNTTTTFYILTSH